MAWQGVPCRAVAEEAVVGEVGAAAEEDVEEEIWSWKASRSLRRAFDCFRAWLYSEFIFPAGEVVRHAHDDVSTASAFGADTWKNA